jgi:hypothetical protein
MQYKLTDEFPYMINDTNTALLPIEIVYEDTYRGFKFYILSLHFYYPTCYIVIPKDHKLYGKCYDDFPDTLYQPHGGFTFSGFHNDETWEIGWDYAHAGDYTTLFNETGHKKWTIGEIVDDAKKVIDSL